MTTTTISHAVTVVQGAGHSGVDASARLVDGQRRRILTFAATQAWIADRKLSLDLFDRRFDTYQALNTALNRRVAEIGGIGTVEEGGFDSSALHAVWEAREKMRLLFPRRVSKQLAIVETDLKAVAMLKAGLSAAPRYTAEEKKEFMTATRRYMDAQSQLGSSREHLLHLVTPLMVQFGFGRTFFTGLFRSRSAPGP